MPRPLWSRSRAIQKHRPRRIHITETPVSVIQVNTSDGFEEAIQRGQEVIERGGVVACPTESFYGLAVDAANEMAIGGLFRIKHRQATEPILLLIPHRKTVRQLVTHVPAIAQRLIREFWPGGLTLVFQAAPDLSSLLTAGTGKIGLRLSSHPAASALARAVGGPITGTSANRSGDPPCRTAAEVMQTLGGSVDLILDGGEAGSRVGSTVLDVTQEPPRLLREGMVARKSLERFVSIGP